MKSFGQKKMVRKMKFISDQEGIMNRYLREKKNWEAHLESTKQFILESFREKSIKSVAVLGSGWLLDLPLKELSEKFKKVVLIDVYHPAQVQKRAEKYKNVTLFETDITGGGINFCWELRKKKGEHFESHVLKDFKPKKPELPIKPDAFISLNILNQLDILLVDFLKKKNGRFTELEYDAFRRHIQQFHLDWILRKPTCLITDIVEINECPGGLSEKKLIRVPFLKPQRSQEWNWDFDLSGMYHEGCNTRMEVKAFEW